MTATSRRASAVSGDADLPDIVFVSSSDPLDKRSFSGVLFYMVEALKVEFPRLQVVRHSRPTWFRRLQRIVRRVSRNRLDPYYWITLNKWFARRLIGQWKGRRVLVIGTVNSTLVAELAASVPVINVSDATFALMRDFYSSFQQFDGPTARMGERAERECIERSVHSSYSSGWAARSAIADYRTPADKVSVIPWGCNLSFVDPAEASGWTPGGPCKLLFIGGDWTRKGGDIVLATARILRERGFDFHLDLVGAKPPEPYAPLPEVTVHGFLNKNDPTQAETILRLYKDASFLFLPTRQDCTPMVFAEANAFGSPGITRDVGGVSGVIEDGVNGFLLPSDASAADFADRIESAWQAQDAYRQLRASARRTYEDRLNWTSWAGSMRAVIDGIQGA